MQRVWQLKAWFMLAVFINAALPKSFLHALHAHHETCDTPGSLSIGTQHEHCTFLQLHLAPYQRAAEQTLSVFVAAIGHAPMHAMVRLADADNVGALTRGPPFV
jgi:hypothetical protein